MRRVPIEDSFDLHSFRPEDVANAVADYLEEAQRLGLREVRIIHGKGIGVRRAEVRKRLAAEPRVREFFDAPPDRGGFGATVVVLGPVQNPESKI
ncbi:MAG TPA: Smr/MutS family protein [Thermoanaerobaculia bacterium]|nr:Smr/MutS family protein [Thermoanaerobaculia bacterium]